MDMNLRPLPGVLLIFVFVAGVLGDTAKLWEPIEWSFSNSTYSGNPYDLVATATFSHATEDNIVTELYYDGGNNWKLRFTGTATGVWSYTTSSTDSDLNNLSGSVNVTDNPGVAGFATKYANGNRWGLTGLNQAFVPQFVMYLAPPDYYNNLNEIDDGIEIFFGDHGFNGFHTSVFCRWFDLYKDSYDEFSTTNPDPDPRTFEALELLITKAHAAGGTTHIWVWGDEQRKMTPIGFDGGKNGTVDRRLQRYICARLGPLPGWSMGYGFDLQEWVNAGDLQTWHNYMQNHLGWSHYLGARAPDMTQIYDGLDYSSYQQHRPDYNMYIQGIEQLHPGKPTFFEDRFRVRDNVYPDKDYTEEMTRQGLYHSTMAGGAANIWGYLIPLPSNDASHQYPNKHWILTYSRFFGLITAPNNHRFTKDMVRDNALTDGVCLRETNDFYVFYRENTSSISMNLSGMSGSQMAVAVDCKDHYEELPLGVLNPSQHTFTAPHTSDWVVAVGGPQPNAPLNIDLGRVDNENGIYRREPGDGDTVVTDIGGKQCRKNATGDAYMYFNVVGSYCYQGSRPELYIRVEYFDQGTASLELQYDSNSAAYTSAGSVALTGSNTWKEHVYYITDAYFGNRQNNKADMRIFDGSGNTFYLNLVKVQDSPPGPPVKAANPSPANNATGVLTNTQLSWSAGDATEFDVYSGPAGSMSFQGRQPQNTFDPGSLNTFTQYQWRIDSINQFGTTTGDLWTFTTASVVQDYDFDGDVDHEDFGFFQICLSGDGVSYPEGCQKADLASDFDVDLNDFFEFVDCMNGANQPPGC
jgi:hypothetical protein